MLSGPVFLTAGAALLFTPAAGRAQRAPQSEHWTPTPGARLHVLAEEWYTGTMLAGDSGQLVL